MSTYTTIEDWLKSDLEQIQWTTRYYEKYVGTLAKDGNKSDHQNLIDSLNSFSSDLRYPKFYERMQKAWYQYNYKKTRKKNQVSFYLNNEVTKKLSQLSRDKKVSQNYILTLLINNSHDISTYFKKHFDEKLQDLKINYEKQHKFKLPQMAELTILEIEVKKLNKEINRLNKKISYLEAIFNLVLEELSILKLKYTTENWTDLTTEEKEEKIKLKVANYKGHYLKDLHRN